MSSLFANAESFKNLIKFIVPIAQKRPLRMQDISTNTYSYQVFEALTISCRLIPLVSHNE